MRNTKCAHCGERFDPDAAWCPRCEHTYPTLIQRPQTRSRVGIRPSSSLSSLSYVGTALLLTCLFVGSRAATPTSNPSATRAVRLLRTVSAAEAHALRDNNAYSVLVAFSGGNASHTPSPAAGSVSAISCRDGSWLHVVVPPLHRSTGWFAVCAPTGNDSQKYYIDETGRIFTARADTPTPRFDSHGSRPGAGWEYVGP